MRPWLVVACLSCGGFASAEVDLFPRGALEHQAEPRSDTVVLPPDSPWRAVERRAYISFSPSVAHVTDETAPAILARQLLRRREAVTTPGDLPPPLPNDARATAADPAALAQSRERQVTAAQSAYEEPAVWQRVELEATVDAKGVLTALRVTHASGRPKLDAAALTAVRRAIGAAGGLGARGRVTARFRVEAGVSVDMPARAINDETRPRPVGGMVPLARGRFGGDRKTEVTAPLQPRVQTHVTLVGLESAR